MQWQYGITCTFERFNDLLPKTIKSLEVARFSEPRLFLDECTATYYASHLETTERYPKIKTFGNWLLSLLELYLRDPKADRYCIFQDDLLAVKNLREYIDLSFPADANIAGSLGKRYLNLYTCREEEPGPGTPRGWHESRQQGRGALGLVFDNRGVRDLFLSGILDHAKDSRGCRGVDGAVVDGISTNRYGLGKMGYKEWVHNPSLLQHTGAVSQTKRHDQPPARSFPGESFDALEFLAK